MTENPKVFRPDRLERLAKAASAVLHPLVVIIPTMVIAMLWQGTPLLQTLFWTIIALGVVIAPLAFLIWRGVKSGRYSDASISIREQRHLLYVVAALLMAALIGILVAGKAPRVLIACLFAAILATAVGFAINSLFTKLSLHSIGYAGCVTVLILLIPALGAGLLALAPLLAWARIYLKHHTVAQILIGWLDASACVLLIFWLFRLP